MEHVKLLQITQKYNKLLNRFKFDTHAHVAGSEIVYTVTGFAQNVPV